jgi:hypothetical protein
MQLVSRQRIGKYVPAATNTHTTIVTIGNCFLLGPCKLVIRKITGETQGFESPAVTRRLYACCSYSETVIITVLKFVARIRLVKPGEDLAYNDL